MANEEAAEVLNEDVAQEQDNAEESTSAVAENAGEDTDPQAAQDQPDDERRRKGGWLRKLTKAEQERDFWREEALRNRNGQEKQPEVQAQAEEKAPVKPVRPKIEEYPGTEEGYKKYEADLGKFEENRDDYYEKKLAWEIKQAENKYQQRSTQQQIADDWATRVAEAKAKHADYEKVAFNEDVPMSNTMMNAIVKHKLGTEIAYELGKNPDEAERISKLDPADALMEIGAIASRIAAKDSAAEIKDEEEVPPAAASRAPKPPSPVRRGSPGNTEPSDSDDYATWLKKRQAQIAKR